jgi:PPOX class probable F420-dependent enzyme
VVPICFALDGDRGSERGVERVVSAVDHKPKSTPALARLADIARTGRATLLVDHYVDDDWSALWWVRVTGAAAILDGADPTLERARAALVAKYPQYREQPPAGPAYVVALDRLTWWRGSDDPGPP